jgi:hypothetical protein
LVCSTVASAGLVLAGTLGVFALVVARQPGGGYVTILATFAIGILLGAFAVRPLLVPSVVTPRPVELVAVLARRAFRAGDGCRCGQRDPGNQGRGGVAATMTCTSQIRCAIAQGGCAFRQW